MIAPSAGKGDWEVVESTKVARANLLVAEGEIDVDVQGGC